MRAARDASGLATRRSTRSSAAARGSDNLVPPIIAAVEARATVGEISDALRRVFGEHEETRCLTAPLLAVEHLTTGFDVARAGSCRRSTTSASRSAQGETLGLVGESGSGKSVTAFSIMRLVQPPGRISGGRDRLQGPRPAARLPEREMQRVRGAEIALRSSRSR